MLSVNPKLLEGRGLVQGRNRTESDRFQTESEPTETGACNSESEPWELSWIISRKNLKMFSGRFWPEDILEDFQKVFFILRQSHGNFLLDSGFSRKSIPGNALFYKVFTWFPWISSDIKTAFSLCSTMSSKDFHDFL